MHLYTPIELSGFSRGRRDNGKTDRNIQQNKCAHMNETRVDENNFNKIIKLHHRRFITTAVSTGIKCRNFKRISFGAQDDITNIPAGLNVLQIVEPLTSTSLLGQIGCSEDSCEVINSKGFPAMHQQVSTRS